jgi:hypothetical protein
MTSAYVPPSMAKFEGTSSAPIPQALHDAIQRVLHETRDFDERTQEWSCQVCRFQDPYGQSLHDPACAIYALHYAWEYAQKPATS